MGVASGKCANVKAEVSLGSWKLNVSQYILLLNMLLPLIYLKG